MVNIIGMGGQDGRNGWSTWIGISNAEELRQKDNIYDAMDYSQDDPYNVIEPYYQFCQENLSKENGEYDIQPAKIYIRNSMEVNAGATRTPNHSIIAVNFGLLPHLFQFFTNGDSIFEREELSTYKPLDEAFDLDYLSYQLTTQFTYYHELAHLIQRSPVLNLWVDELYARNIREGDGYDLKKHVFEFDADLFGAGQEALHMIQYWKRLEPPLQTPANLGLLLSVGVGATFSYFLMLMENYANMYYKASDHPHPMVRILYIVDMFVKTAALNFPEGVALDLSEILRQGFRLTQLWFARDPGPHTAIGDFPQFFKNEQQQIADYVNNVLIQESQKYSELVMNRQARKLNL